MGTLLLANRRVMALSLDEGDVHVWTSHVESRSAELSHLRSLLSSDECDRADRFTFERHQQAFVVARGTLREVLASYVDVQPQNVSFVYGAHGKPALASAALQFNASHSGDRIVIAVTRVSQVGVDIEQHRPVEYLELAERFFSPREIDVLRAAGAENLAPMFDRCWTRKEAYVKARGRGLSLPLRDFAVSLGADAGAGLVWSREGDAELQRWELRPLDMDAEHTAALVVERPVRELRRFECGAVKEPERGETGFA